jgi:hypothetical protein
VVEPPNSALGEYPLHDFASFQSKRFSFERKLQGLDWVVLALVASPADDFASFHSNRVAFERKQQRWELEAWG